MGKKQWNRDPFNYKGQNIFRFENGLMSAFVISEVIGKQKPLVKHL